MLKNLMMGTAAVALSVTAMAGSANALVIDTFETSLAVAGGILNASGGGTATDVSVGAGILGGDRELILDHTNNDGFIGAQVSGGIFRHANASGSTGESLLRWDGTGGSMGLEFGLGSVDLTAGGFVAIHIRALGADLNTVPASTVTLTLYTDADSYSTAQVVLPVGNSDHFLLLSDVAATLSGTDGGVDLLDVNAIELLAVGGVAFDVGIDIIETTTVPEPASLTLLGAGLMGLGYFGKRRKA